MNFELCNVLQKSYIFSMFYTKGCNEEHQRENSEKADDSCKDHRNWMLVPSGANFY